MTIFEKVCVVVMVLSCWAIGIFNVLSIDSIIKRHAAEDSKVVCTTLAQALHNEEKRLEQYLHANGSRYSREMAAACMLTSNPQLCGAMALVESTANPYVAPGDSGKSKGAFQIQERYWKHFVGSIETDPFLQAEQWDAIMALLLETRSLPGAISAYNGHGKGYVSKVWVHYRELLK